MKKIYRIARLELSILFFSPIAWLVLIIFIFQTAIIFINKLDGFEVSSQMGYRLRYITFEIFSGNYGVFTEVQKNLYLYIPLLTMGLMSRETSSGSIKLLLSSPVKISNIILGKFLAMMIYCFFLIMILISFGIAGAFSIGSMETSVLISGLIGLYLLVLAYSAIGLFMSCLTSYQVVAAVSTLAVLAALNFVGDIGQNIDLVRDITYWISISGRSDNFIGGLISSKDVIYFLIVIGLFLTMSIMRLSEGRYMRSAVIKYGRYTLLIVVAIFVGYLSSLPKLNAYLDMTRNLRRTLTENSQKIVKQMDKPFTITTYVNILDYNFHYGKPTNRIKDMNAFEQFRRFLPGFKMKYVTYFDTPINKYWLNRYPEKSLFDLADKTATANRLNMKKILNEEQIRALVDLSPEENRMVRILEYDNKTTALRMFDDMLKYPGEAEISAAIKRLIVDAPIIGFLTGHRERSVNKVGDRSYKNITTALPVRSSLINQGFDVENISIEGEIPFNLTALIIADPKSEYTVVELAKIQDYIEQGGNLLIAGEPGKQSILNEITKKLGVEFMSGTLLQESKDYELDLLVSRFTPMALDLGFKYVDEARVSMPSAVGLKYETIEDFKTTPILMTDSIFTWNRLGTLDLESGEERFDSIADAKIQVPVALGLTREINGREQKILILGDADYMSNAELGRTNVRTVNGLFTLKIFKWFSDGEFPIAISRPPSIDNSILINRQGVGLFKVIFFILIPLVLGIMGFVILIRRKRQ